MKQTIRSLTKKGFSQKKIAKTLHIRKEKVVKYQIKHKIGRRAEKGGAREFWEDVKLIKQMKEMTHKEAITEVKWSPRWYKKRITGVNKREKAREEMRKKWKDIMKGQGEARYWEQAESEDLMEAAEYGG